MSLSWLAKKRILLPDRFHRKHQEPQTFAPFLWLQVDSRLSLASTCLCHRILVKITKKSILPLICLDVEKVLTSLVARNCLCVCPTSVAGSSSSWETQGQLVGAKKSKRARKNSGEEKSRMRRRALLFILDVSLPEFFLTWVDFSCPH